jgi:hypothetical protein
MTSSSDTIGRRPAAPATDALIGESRWPPAVAVLMFLVLNLAIRIWLPEDRVIHVPWLAPALLVALLLLLAARDPSAPAERRRLRRVTLIFVGVLALAALWATALLISDLIQGTGHADDAGDLLASGALVWVGNNLVFGLFYWLMDGGGPIERLQREVPLDFAFTQQMSPELAPAGWRPVFLDYVHLGFTNATAFSPTDVMPLTHRAKFAMLVQATIALALFGLVVARAVNAFQ